jgi:hypothetical protein
MITHSLVTCHRKIEAPSDALKRVAERAMPYVVDERRGERDLRVACPKPGLSEMLFNNVHQQTCCVKDANTVGQTRMRCPRIHKFRKTKLLDPTQSLKGSGLNYRPHNVVELIGSEFNEIMKRVANALAAKLHDCFMLAVSRSAPKSVLPF